MHLRKVSSIIYGNSLNLFNGDEVHHDIEAVSIRLEGQFLTTVSLHFEITVLRDSQNSDLFITPSGQLHSLVTATPGIIIIINIIIIII